MEHLDTFTTTHRTHPRTTWALIIPTSLLTTTLILISWFHLITPLLTAPGTLITHATGALSAPALVLAAILTSWVILLAFGGTYTLLTLATTHLTRSAPWPSEKTAPTDSAPAGYPAHP